MELSEIYCEREKKRNALCMLQKEFEEAKRKLEHEIHTLSTDLVYEADGLDRYAINLAESVLYVTNINKGGADWRGCIEDAIHEIATGKSRCFDSLWKSFYGTKNYDRWQGQRSDHTYGYGPKHGSICFGVGLKQEVRDRDPQSLTPEEKEACLYYLTRIGRIQKAMQGD